MPLQVALPERVKAASPAETQERIVAAKEALGKRLVDPGPPLPARRGDPARGLHRRLLQARPARGAAGRRPTSSSSAASTSWRSPRTSSPPTHQKVMLPGHERRLHDGGHGRDRAGRGLLGGRHGGRRRGHPARHLHELHRGPQGVRGPPRRGRLHVVERARGARLGVPAASRACCSSPTSTSAATPATAWASRSSGCRSGTPTRTGAGSPPTQMRDAPILLWKGHCSVHNRFTPEMVDRRRAQIPGVKVIVHPECRFEVAQKADAIGSTEGIIKTVAGEPAGDEVGGGHRAEPREPPGPRAGAGARGREPRRLLLRLQHDVPHRPAAPALGARGPRGGRGVQPGAGARRRSRARRASPSTGCSRSARSAPCPTKSPTTTTRTWCCGLRPAAGRSDASGAPRHQPRVLAPGLSRTCRRSSSPITRRTRPTGRWPATGRWSTASPATASCTRSSGSRTTGRGCSCTRRRRPTSSVSARTGSPPPSATPSGRRKATVAGRRTFETFAGRVKKKLESR